jgi:hypothetical protein
MSRLAPQDSGFIDVQTSIIEEQPTSLIFALLRHTTDLDNRQERLHLMNGAQIRYQKIDRLPI